MYLSILKRNLRLISLMTAAAFIVGGFLISSVMALAAPSTYYVDPLGTDDPAFGLSTGAGAFHSIQYAVSVAVAGDIINVSGGDFVETVPIIIDKDLTIAGAGKDLTIVRPANGGMGLSIFKITAGTLSISDLKIDGDGYLASPTVIRRAVRTEGTGSVAAESLVITNIKEQTYEGYAFALTSGTNTVVDTEMSNIERVGVFALNPTTQVTVTGSTYTGKGVGDFVDNGYESNNSVLILDDSVAMNCQGIASTDGSESAGVVVWSGGNASAGQATITNSEFSDNQVGIGVGILADDASFATVSNSSFENNASYDVATFQPGNYVTAENNWWGSIDPDFAAAVSGNVDYDPYYIDDAMSKTNSQVDTDLATASAAAAGEAEIAYTAASWASFFDARTAASSLPESTNAEKMSKTDAFNAAIAMLVLKADLSAYNAALAAVVESAYTPGSWATYNAVVIANAVTTENTQTEVDTATANITAAQASLVTVIDANLADAKTAAGALSSADYTVISWQALTDALALPESNDTEKTDKAASINNAINGLVMKADLTGYNAALAAVTESNFTPDSWAAYQAVVSANQVTAEDTQAAVDTATQNILAAQFDLVTIIDADLAAAKAAESLLVSTDYVDYSAVSLALALPENNNTEKVTKTNALNGAMSGLVTVASIFTSVSDALSAAGIANNFDTVNGSNWKSFTGLSFEKRTNIMDATTALGRVTFDSALDLSSSETQTFLQNLGTKFDASAVGTIGLDLRGVSDAMALKGVSATIKFFGLDALGFSGASTADEIVSRMVAYDDNGNVIDRSGLISTTTPPTYLGACEVMGPCYIFTVPVNHFTTYKIDTGAPTVTKLGDGSADVQLPAGTSDLSFSEELSPSSKSAVENALTAGADKPLSYSWTGSTLAMTAGSLVTFANDVVVSSISDMAGNVSISVLLVDSKLESAQIAPTTAPDGSGDASLSSTTPEVVITDPGQQVDVTIDGDAINPSIDVSSFITGGSGTLPAINIISNNAFNATIAIPSSTVVTSASTSWNGVIAAPTVTTVTLPTVSGQTNTLNSAIEVGFSGAKLSFSKAVRLSFAGQAGKRVGYSRTGEAFTEITTTCGADSQVVGDALAADGDCKIDAGSDLVVWTKHFTTFATFTQTANASNGGGGGFIPATNCASVTFAEWGSCVNGVQFRNILSQEPSGCSLTSLQQADRSRSCASAPSPTASSTGSEPEDAVTKKVLGEKVYAEGTIFRKADGRMYIIKNGTEVYIRNLGELRAYIAQAAARARGAKAYANGTLIRHGDKKIHVILNGKEVDILNLTQLRKYAGVRIIDVAN